MLRFFDHFYEYLSVERSDVLKFSRHWLRLGNFIFPMEYGPTGAPYCIDYVAQQQSLQTNINVEMALLVIPCSLQIEISKRKNVISYWLSQTASDQETVSLAS